MSHTQGKLHFTEEPASEINDWVTSHVVRAPVNNFPLAVLSNYSGTEREANARRLVACWNACDGMPTTLLEQIPGVVGATLPYHRLEAQRNELLEALKECAAVCAGETMSKSGLVRALEKARAAIQKAEGKV